MEIKKLKDFVRGWLVGNFEPSLWKTESCEVSIKNYKIGDRDEYHYHGKTTEFTVIVNGQAQMGNVVYNSGDIIIIKPYEMIDFLALSDVTTVVIRDGSFKNDKFYGLPDEERI